MTPHGLAVKLLALSALFSQTLNAAEDLSRSERLQADREALVSLLQRPAPQEEVKRVLTQVRENNGQTGLPVVFWLRLGVTPVLEQWSIAESAKTSLKAFNQGLQARGIHLIVVPVPTSVTTHLHRLSDKIKPDQDLMPGYTRGLIDLIDAGIEVVDLRQAFAEASDPETNPLMNRADFHWATGGVALATEVLAPRLLRMDGIQALESRPQDWQRGTKTIKQPNMSLSRGNGIYNAKREGLYKTEEEAFHANDIPLEEEAIWYTYTGKERISGWRTFGGAKGGALDQPFIIIGDSQARENTNRNNNKPQNGGGLFNQLSAKLGIMGTVFSMNGDVDRVPSVFVEKELPELTRTQVLVLVGRMGDFCGGSWRPPLFPETDSTTNDAATSSDGPSGTFSVVLSEVATIGDPEEADYDDALVAAVATITDGPRKGQRVKIMTLGMLNRKVDPAMKVWQNGARIHVNISDFKAKMNARPELTRTQTMDEVEDLMMIEYWADIVTP